LKKGFKPGLNLPLISSEAAAPQDVSFPARETRAPYKPFPQRQRKAVKEETVPAG